MTKNTSAQLRCTFLLVFFLSGVASLVYQVAWQRLLTVYYGVGSISVTLIVSVYMFGLGIGSLSGGYIADRVKDSLWVYLITELLLGVFGFLSLPFINYLGRWTAGSSYIITFGCMYLFLSVPTFLMGTTLPMLTKIYNRLTDNFLQSVGLMYFVNTLGATIGAVFTSYIVISFFSLRAGIYFAVLLNLCLATVIFITKYSIKSTQHNIDFRSVDEPVLQQAPETSGKRTVNLIYLLVFIGGFLAIGYEIIWFRMIGVLVKASPYAFSTILSIYLFGIALGSFGIQRYLGRHKGVGRRDLYFFLQFLLGVYVALSIIGYYILTKYTPMNIFTQLSFANNMHPCDTLPDIHSVTGFIIGLYAILDIFFWPLFFVFIPTVFMGASFPLLASLALPERNKEGSTVGNVYFFNIMGNMLGGIVTGFAALPLIGTELTLMTYSSIGIILGIFASSCLGWQSNFTIRGSIIFCILIISITIFPKKGKLYEIMHPPAEMYLIKNDMFAKRRVHTLSNEDKKQVVREYLQRKKNGTLAAYKGITTNFEEGIDGTVSTWCFNDYMMNFINGLAHGRRPGYQYYRQVIEAVSYASKVQQILVIGFGTGSTVESLLGMDEVEKITVVEVNSTLMDNIYKFPAIKNIATNPKVNLIIDDGRRFMSRCTDIYDVILIDPIHTTTAYSNNLYSRQFFQLAGDHLSNKGIFLAWHDECQVFPRTIASCFDYVREYNYFCLASKSPFIHNHQSEQKIWAQFSDGVRDHIREYVAEYIGDKAYILNYTQGLPINEDYKPVCEYYLGKPRLQREIISGGNQSGRR